MSLQSKVSSHIDAPGVSVNIIDYRWPRGAEIVEHGFSHVLRRRATPTRRDLSAMLGTTRQPFGDLMFLPADVTIRTNAAKNDEHVRTITCFFDPGWFANLAEIPREWARDELARCLDLRNSRIDQAIQWMGNEAMSPGIASALLIESLGSVIAVELARHFVNPTAGLRVRTQDGKLLPVHLNRIINYIESSTCKCPTMDEIAKACGVSAAHLRRAFKNTTGNTIHQFVETTRLEKAKTLLTDTDLPLKEVSYRLGFATSSTFSTAFRKLQGETPSGYRSRMRQ